MLNLLFPQSFTIDEIALDDELGLLMGYTLVVLVSVAPRHDAGNFLDSSQDPAGLGGKPHSAIFRHRLTVLL